MGQKEEKKNSSRSRPWVTLPLREKQITRSAAPEGSSRIEPKPPENDNPRRRWHRPKGALKKSGAMLKRDRTFLRTVSSNTAYLAPLRSTTEEPYGRQESSGKNRERSGKRWRPQESWEGQGRQGGRRGRLRSRFCRLVDYCGGLTLMVMAADVRPKPSGS